jgi:hypothetical protein
LCEKLLRTISTLLQSTDTLLLHFTCFRFVSSRFFHPKQLPPSPIADPNITCHMCQATVPSETRQDQTRQLQVGTPVRIMQMYAINRVFQTLRVSEALPHDFKGASRLPSNVHASAAIAACLTCCSACLDPASPGTPAPAACRAQHAIWIWRCFRATAFCHCVKLYRVVCVNQSSFTGALHTRCIRFIIIAPSRRSRLPCAQKGNRLVSQHIASLISYMHSLESSI